MTPINLKDIFCDPVKSQEIPQILVAEYEFSCLPFSLSTAPSVFTKLLRPVTGFLRSNEIHYVIYLDDLLIMHQNKKVLLEQMSVAVGLLGALISYPKRQLEPMEVIDFLGFVVDSLKRKVRLPKEKISQIKQEAHTLLTKEYTSARKLAQSLGKMSAAILAIYPAPLHYSELQNLKL